MKVITIITRSEIYKVNEKDQITYARWGHASDTWRLRGAMEFRFGMTHKVYSVEDIRAGKVPWKYKNGKQRCFIMDYDHGTYRVWMSPGIIDVMVTEEEEKKVG